MTGISSFVSEAQDEITASLASSRAIGWRFESECKGVTDTFKSVGSWDSFWDGFLDEDTREQKEKESAEKLLEMRHVFHQRLQRNP